MTWPICIAVVLPILGLVAWDVARRWVTYLRVRAEQDGRKIVGRLGELERRHDELDARVRNALNTAWGRR